MNNKVDRCKWCDSIDTVKPCIKCGYQFCYNHRVYYENENVPVMQFICLECRQLITKALRINENPVVYEKLPSAINQMR